MDSPLSLRPQPPKNRGPQSVAEFIQRVGAQPGGFRSLSHEEIRRRLDAKRNPTAADATAADAQLANSDGEQEVEEGEDAGEAGGKPKDLAVARDEMRLAVETAHFNARLTLDFISLLLSKEEPTRAIDTISPELRNLVGIGTMGATVLDAPTALSRSRVTDHKLVAMGKRLVDIGRVADSVLAAARRLRREIGLEARYWGDVLAVREQGWSVFRLPHDPLAMGVEFGFSSAAPDFKAGSVAPMRRAADGTASLEHGPRFAASKRIQVTIKQAQPRHANTDEVRDGQDELVVVVGRSSLPQPLPEDAPLQDRVMEARNTIFAEELWFELNREGRTLFGQGIRSERDQITYSPSREPSRTICFRLVDLESDDEQQGPGAAAQPASEDGFAETINLAIHLLLTNAHRQNSLRRNEQTLAPAGGPRQRGAPSSSGAGGLANNIPAPYALLLPIITYLQHEEIIQDLATFLSALTTLLRSAGVPAASCVLAEAPVPSGLAAGLAPPEALVSGLLRPPDIQFDLTLIPEARLRIVVIRSQAVPVPLFQVTLLPPLPVSSSSSAPDDQGNNNSGGGGRNILAQYFPPSNEVYPSFGELLWYLCGAVPRALTMLSVPLAIRAAQAQARAPQQQQQGRPDLAVDFGGCGLVDDTTLRYGVSFSCVLRGAGYHGDDDGEDKNDNDDDNQEDDTGKISNARDGATTSRGHRLLLPLPQLRAQAIYRDEPRGRTFARREWRWRMSGGRRVVCSAGPGPDGEEGRPETVEGVVGWVLARLG